MAVPSSLVDLSTTAASNSPAGSESIGTSLDDYLRAVQAIIKQGVSKGSDIASAATITPVATSSYFVVTGTTGITAIGETYSWTGRVLVLKFSGAVLLTHSSGLLLPGAANITTAAGDVLAFVNESAGVWRCVFGNTGLLLTGGTMNGGLIFKAGLNNVASASPLVLTGLNANTLHVTGTTGFTAVTMTSGQVVDLVFDGVLTLTHHATTNNLPGGADITTAAGDRARYWYDGTTVRCMTYQKVDGTAVATTAATAPVGASRNLVGSAAGSAKTASWTADHLVAYTALAGTAIVGASLSLSFDGATTGAGGMDTGATPTSADLHIYAIYKSGTGWSCVGTISGTGASIYPGANMPSGYTHSALIWSGKTDGSGNLVAFNQRDRKVACAKNTVINAVAGVTSWTSKSISAAVPVNARSVSGFLAHPNNAGRVFAVAADSAGNFSAHYSSGAVTTAPMDGFYSASNFDDLLLITAQTLYMKCYDTQAASFSVVITGYQI